MNNGILVLIMLGALALALAGCKAGVPGETPASDALEQTGTWRLATMTIKGVVTTRPESAKATLRFANGQVSGTGACNAFSDSYQIIDGTLSFGEGFMSTAMGCDNLDFETKFLTALAASTEFELGGETLTLSDGTPDFQLSFLPNVITHLPLEGTNWSCFGFQEADSDTAAMTKAQIDLSIRFQADGTASGSVACNTFNASAKVSSGSAIKIQVMDVTEEGCSGTHVGQEADFLLWLNAADSYQINASQLVLIDSETQQSLVFRAAAP